MMGKFVTVSKTSVISLIALTVLSLFCLAGCSLGVGTSASTPGPQVGMMAPDFEFKDAADKTVSLSDLQGKPIVLNFWATWCGPCKTEMPIIQKLADDGMVAGGGLILLTVNCGDSAETVNNFMQEYGYSFPVLLDTTKNIMRTYNVRYIPTTFFIGTDGIISEIKMGAFTEESQLDRILNDLIP